MLREARTINLDRINHGFTGRSTQLSQAQWGLGRRQQLNHARKGIKREVRIKEKVRRRRRGLSQAVGDKEPAARVFAGEGSLSIVRADFEAHGLEGFDFPTIGKGMAQLGLRDASRSFRPRGGVAETKQEQTPPGIEDGIEPAHVANAVRVGKNVKQAGVEYVIEAFGPLMEF